MSHGLVALAIALGVVIMCLSTGCSRSSTTVVDLVREISPGETLVLYYAFAAGDEAIVDLSTADGRQGADVRILEWPSQIRFERTGLAKISRLSVPVTHKSILALEVSHRQPVSQPIKLSLRRRPAPDGDPLFNSTVATTLIYDTTWTKFRDSSLAESSFTQKVISQSVTVAGRLITVTPREIPITIPVPCAATRLSISATPAVASENLISQLSADPMSTLGAAIGSVALGPIVGPVVYQVINADAKSQAGRFNAYLLHDKDRIDSVIKGRERGDWRLLSCSGFRIVVERPEVDTLYLVIQHPSVIFGPDVGVQIDVFAEQTVSWWVVREDSSPSVRSRLVPVTK